MQERNKQDVLYAMAHDLTYNRQGLEDFLRKNGSFVKVENDQQLANSLFDFLSASQLNREKYASFLVKDEYRNAIDPISLTIIITSVISVATGTAGAVRQGKVQRQAEARFRRSQDSLEEATYAEERESRRLFLTNLFAAQQQMLIEDEKSFRQAQTLKRISLGFMIITIILGGVWLTRRNS